MEMKKEIVLLDADEKESAYLVNLLEKYHYRPTVTKTTMDLDNHLNDYKGQVVLINTDTISVTNRSLRELKREYPSIYILTMSRRPFHPELKEAIGSYVYACLTLPIEPDEINYLLKSIYENEADSIQ